MGLVDKVKQWAGQNQDKVGKGVDAAARKADNATGGKYTEKINQAAQKAKTYAEDSGGQQPGEEGDSQQQQRGPAESEPPEQQDKPDSGSTR